MHFLSLLITLWAAPFRPPSPYSSHSYRFPYSQFQYFIFISYISAILCLHPSISRLLFLSSPFSALILSINVTLDSVPFHYGIQYSYFWVTLYLSLSPRILYFFLYSCFCFLSATPLWTLRLAQLNFLFHFCSLRLRNLFFFITGNHVHIQVFYFFILSCHVMLLFLQYLKLVTLNILFHFFFLCSNSLHP